MPGDGRRSTPGIRTRRCYPPPPGTTDHLPITPWICALFRCRQQLMLDYLENNGYPFAKVGLDSVVLRDSGAVSAVLKVDKGPLYKIDSIRVFGNAKISNRIPATVSEYPQWQHLPEGQAADHHQKNPGAALCPGTAALEPDHAGGGIGDQPLSQTENGAARSTRWSASCPATILRLAIRWWSPARRRSTCRIRWGTGRR